MPSPLPVGWTDAEKLLGNYPDTADTLRPYECVVLKKVKAAVLSFRYWELTVSFAIVTS